MWQVWEKGLLFFQRYAIINVRVNTHHREASYKERVAIMNHKKAPEKNAFTKRKGVDLIFAGVALLFLILMIVLLVIYTGLHNQNQARPEEYGIAMQDLNESKIQKNDLESKLDAVKREIDDLQKQIHALRGN